MSDQIVSPPDPQRKRPDTFGQTEADLARYWQTIARTTQSITLRTFARQMVLLYSRDQDSES